LNGLATFWRPERMSLFGATLETPFSRAGWGLFKAAMIKLYDYIISTN